MYAFLFQSEKALLKDALRAELEEKVRRLEEDRHNIDLTTGRSSTTLHGKILFSLIIIFVPC